MATHEEHGRPVIVFETADPGVLAVAQSLLQEAGIEHVVRGEALLGVLPGVHIGAHFTPAVVVPADQADAARELLAGLGETSNEQW